MKHHVFATALLEYFVGEKRLRMSQINRKCDPFPSNYAFWQGSYIYTSTNLGFAILLINPTIL